MCQVISEEAERNRIDCWGLEDRPQISKVRWGSKSLVRREDQIMQNNLITKPRKASGWAYQDRTTLVISGKELQTFADESADCRNRVSRGVEGSKFCTGNGKSKSKLVGRRNR